MLSPITPSLPLPGLVHDLEELKKDVMQSAAARAKQRRQQEEEEREAQKDRARRKAAELEVKMKAEVEEKARNEMEAEQIKKESDQERANRKDGRISVRFFLNYFPGPGVLKVSSYRITRQTHSSGKLWRLEEKRKPIQT